VAQHQVVAQTLLTAADDVRPTDRPDAGRAAGDRG
jgi:hypothetical protein